MLMPYLTSISSLGVKMSATIRTTLAIPADLLKEADRVVKAGGARSRNELLTQALRRELAARERAAIDAELLEMANDAEYQAEARMICEEFDDAAGEALKLAETEG